MARMPNFKLSTGTWVRVGPLRASLLAHLENLAQDVVIAGHDRDFVGALIFPNHATLQRIGMEALREACGQRLLAFAGTRGGRSTTIRRAVVLDRPPAIDAQELTEKGSVNQTAVLANRAEVVERLFAGTGASVLDITQGTSVGGPA